MENIIFMINDGLSFPEIANESVDLAFSGWTMQHMPTKSIVVENIREMARTLKVGGLYKIDPVIRAPSLRGFVMKSFLDVARER